MLARCYTCHKYINVSQAKVAQVQSGNGVAFVHVCSVKCRDNPLFEPVRKSMYYDLFL